MGRRGAEFRLNRYGRSCAKSRGWLERPGSEQRAGAMIDEAAAIGPAIEMPEILRRIPHRYPFLLIDRAEDYQPHKSIMGIKCVTMNEPFFQGHFPNNPVMPGVLIVEALGQTGAVLMS